MTLRTEGDIVRAANLAQDLTNLVVAYLEFYKKHAQGLNGVNIPTEHYTVIFRPITKEGRLPVKIIYTRTHTWTEPTYYDVDSDYFDGTWGGSNISGSVTESKKYLEEDDLNIPVAALLLARDEMERRVKEFAARKRAELQEQERLTKIAQHEAEIARLRSVSTAQGGAKQ